MRRLSTFLATMVLSIHIPVPAGRINAGSKPNPMHPAFRLLDGQGIPIQQAGRELDQIRTCGQCHSTPFINNHSLPAHWQLKIDCLTCHYEGEVASWSAEALDPNGMLKRSWLKIFKPSNSNCGSCHGLTGAAKIPVSVPEDYQNSAYPTRGDDPERYQLTRATGAIFSPEEISSSFFNLSGKETLHFSWDVHARKLMQCTDCHYAPNNPQRVAASSGGVALLRGEPRRETVSGYLQQPDHLLTKADCQTCHQPERGHGFLPYRARHLEIVACESCHIPRQMGPAERMVDATILDESGRPLVEYRGSERGDSNLNTAFSGGYVPLLLPMQSSERAAGMLRLTPVNVVSRWYWASGDGQDPLPRDLLRQALMQDGHYRPEVVALLDLNHDGTLDRYELRLDTEPKRKLVERLLREAGASNPVIRAEVRIHRVSHGVAGRNQALAECSACHGLQSRLNRTILLASWTPAATLPVWKNKPALAGTMKTDPNGQLIWTPETGFQRTFHVFGLSGNEWPDRVGLALLISVVLAVATHTAYRMMSGQRRQYSTSTRKEYLFTAYERIWHWVMALSVVGLIFTGLQIRFPGGVRILSATNLVATHNFFAVVLALNAFLALFYHLATAAIRQFLPNRQGVAEALTLQTKYYLRDIFKGLPSPFPRSPERKLNVLQQFTYLLLLNVLFPFQVITGAAIWGVGMSPAFADWIGGLSVLAPLHTLGSWMFLSFLVAHVYLTTTGHTVFAHLRGMIEGYEEVAEAAPVEGGSV